MSLYYDRHYSLNTSSVDFPLSRILILSDIMESQILPVVQLQRSHTANHARIKYVLDPETFARSRTFDCTIPIVHPRSNLRPQTGNIDHG